MRADEQKLIRRGPAVLLALLLTFLVGGAGPAAAAAVADGAAAFRQPQTAKVAELVRASRRVADEEPDRHDGPPLWLGRDPSVETILLSSRPAAQAAPAPSLSRAGARAAPFRARAPPAA